MHSPAARLKHEQRAPVTVFSVAARLQLHWSWKTLVSGMVKGRGERHEHTADCLPQEQVAFSAQTHEPERLQQVAGLVTILIEVCWFGFGVFD